MTTTLAPAALASPLGGDVWFHGSRAHPSDLGRGFLDPMFTVLGSFEDPDEQEDGHWNATLGPHFTASHDLAGQFANGDHESGDNAAYETDGEAYSGVVHARLHLANPKVYESEYDIDREVYEAEFAAGNHPSGFFGEYAGDDDLLEYSWPDAARLIRRYGDGPIPPGDYDPGYGGQWPMCTTWLNSHPGRWEIGLRFRQRLTEAGYDGIIYRNEYEAAADGRAPDTCVIVFDTVAIEVCYYHHTAARCGQDTPHSAPGPGDPDGPADAGDTVTHGQWQQAVGAVRDRIGELPGALEVMLASLTAAHAGRSQVTGVMALAGQGAAWAGQIGAMLTAVDAREMPVVGAVADAGGPAEIAGISYMAEA